MRPNARVFARIDTRRPSRSIAAATFAACLLAFGAATHAATHAATAPDNVYDPPAGTYPYFAGSAPVSKIPRDVRPDPKSAAWLAYVLPPPGPSAAPIVHGFQFAADPRSERDIARDYGIAVYSGAQRTAVTISCSGAPCEGLPRGTVVRVDPAAEPQSGAAATADAAKARDHHYAIVDTAAGYEYDLWLTAWPPVRGVLTTYGNASRCALASSDFSGCRATASHWPLSLGLVRVSDLLAALDDPHGSLPYAIAFQSACVNGYTAPASNVDTGDIAADAACAPYGVRLYLDLHDSDVNASGLSKIEKVLARTLDRDHYGAFMTDKTGEGGHASLTFQVENDTTYASFGRPGPWATAFKAEYEAEFRTRLEADPASHRFYAGLPFAGIDLRGRLRMYCVTSNPCRIARGR